MYKLDLDGTVSILLNHYVNLSELKKSYCLLFGSINEDGDDYNLIFGFESFQIFFKLERQIQNERRFQVSKFSEENSDISVDKSDVIDTTIKD